jgi:hypothetical protein
MAGILGIAVIGSGSVGLPKNRLNKINLPKTDTSPNCPKPSVTHWIFKIKKLPLFE